MIRFELVSNNEVNENSIKAAVKEFDRRAKLKGVRSFSLAFVDGPTIRKWNGAYRGKDKITDVLSFAERDSDPDNAKFFSQAEKGELGEILICVSRAKKQAKEYGWSYDHEVCRLLVHGLAHLIGYEHEGVSERTAEKMFAFERGVMDSVAQSAGKNKKK